MIRAAMIRAARSFQCAVAINVIVYAVLLLFFHQVPLVPDYAMHFKTDGQALLLQLVLIGLMSAVLGGGTIILELERVSLLVQSLLYLILSLAVWVPVGCYCFRLHKYVTTMIGFGASYVVSYAICWIIQYKTCKKNIAAINERLKEMTEAS